MLAEMKLIYYKRTSVGLNEKKFGDINLDTGVWEHAICACSKTLYSRLIIAKLI